MCYMLHATWFHIVIENTHPTTSTLWMCVYACGCVFVSCVFFFFFYPAKQSWLNGAHRIFHCSHHLHRRPLLTLANDANRKQRKKKITRVVVPTGIFAYWNKQKHGRTSLKWNQFKHSIITDIIGAQDLLAIRVHSTSDVSWFSCTSTSKTDGWSRIDTNRFLFLPLLLPLLLYACIDIASPIETMRQRSTLSTLEIFMNSCS